MKMANALTNHANLKINLNPQLRLTAFVKLNYPANVTEPRKSTPPPTPPPFAISPRIAYNNPAPANLARAARARYGAIPAGENPLPAKKAGRQAAKRALRNRSAKTATRTITGRAARALASGDPETARPAVLNAVRTLDRAVRKGILHQNNAARRKSRMMTKLARLEQPAAEA